MYNNSFYFVIVLSSVILSGEYYPRNISKGAWRSVREIIEEKESDELERKDWSTRSETCQKRKF